MSIAGAVDGPAFALSAGRVLDPGLRPGQVVVLDNLNAYKHEDARKAIEEAAGRLLFLPVSSPDRTPIALAFAKVKGRLRAAFERTVDALVAATASALVTVTAADARGFSAHRGFSLPSNYYATGSRWSVWHIRRMSARVRGIEIPR